MAWGEGREEGDLRARASLRAVSHDVGAKGLVKSAIDHMFTFCSNNAMSREWLFRRLLVENTCDRPDRWKAVLANLKSLQGVDESTIDQCNATQEPTQGQRHEAAPHSGLQSIARPCEQGEGGSGTSPDSLEDTLRRNVGSLRETPAEQKAMSSSRELKLVAVAAALIDNKRALTATEKKLLRTAGSPDEEKVANYRKRIQKGEDPLGVEFCEIRSPETRRKVGAIYTPHEIIEAMISWASSVCAAPERVVDPGVGSGRFILAAAAKFPNAKLVGVDIDPLALLMTRANAFVRGYAHRLRLELGDYRSVALPECEGRTLYIGNPPYVRHHDISERWKTWFAGTAHQFGFKASKLAGLHLHFFLRTREIAKHGDLGAFITAAE